MWYGVWQYAVFAAIVSTIFHIAWSNLYASASFSAMTCLCCKPCLRGVVCELAGQFELVPTNANSGHRVRVSRMRCGGRAMVTSATCSVQKETKQKLNPTI